MKLDETDLAILNILGNDGRMSYVELGKLLLISSTAIRERVKQLKQHGIIEQFTVWINSEKAGQGVSSFLKVECAPSSLIAVAEKLTEHPYVIYCYQMTGTSNLHIHVLAENFTTLEAFINHGVYALEGIKHVESHFLIRTFKSSRYR